MKLFRAFLSYYRPYKWIFLLDMLCVLAVSAIDLIFPQVLNYLNKNVVLRPVEEITRALLWISLGLGILYVIRYFCQYFIGSWGHIMGAKMERDMRQDLFHRYQTLSFSYYDHNNTGEMMSRLVTDLFDITELAHHGPEMLLIAFLKIIGSFILLLRIHTGMTVVLLGVTILMSVFTFCLNVKIRRLFTENRKKIAAVNAGVQDSLAGIRVVKSFGNETLEQNKFDRRNEEFLSTKVSSYRALGFMHAGNSFFQGLLYVAILAGGGWFIGYHSLEPMELAIYALYVGIFLGPLDMLLHFTESFQRGYTGFKRFYEIVSLIPQIADSPNARELSSVQGKASFRNVNFAYDKDIPVLKNVSFDMMPGKTVALVGASGGGKSTICALLPRFYDPQEGRVELDGCDIRDFTLASLRRHIGIVQQDTYMFCGSIRDNILYGRPDATMEEVIDAAKRANIHDFIESLPDGYDSYVGERGVRLSGGQKQRISIARVFLKNPPILILDEATSALDNESERKIQAALVELSRGRTTLVIAHRLSTVRNADEILVVDHGEIVERGNHDSLLEQKGIYAKLYALQFS